MAALGDFLPYVLPHVPGCPDIAARAEILRAAIRFCEQSKVWKVVQAGVDVVAGTASYAVPCPTGGKLALIQEAYFDGKPIKPKTPDDLRTYYGANWQAATGTPQWFTQLDPDNVILVPIPTADLTEGLVIEGVYKPARAAITVPDFLFERYADVIGHGAAAFLLATPKNVWFNAQAAAIQQDLFESGTAHARSEAAKGFGRARQRVRGHYF